MTTPTPTLMIELGCTSVLEFADLAPRVLGPHALFMSGPIRQLEKDCARKFDVSVSPYPLDKARWELEAEVLKHQDAMARSPAASAKLKALLEAGDKTDDVFRIADLIREVRETATNPFLSLR